MYTQYIYNFPKALTTLNACKLKGPFKAFLQVHTGVTAKAGRRDRGT